MKSSQAHAARMCTHNILLNADEHLERVCLSGLVSFCHYKIVNCLRQGSRCVRFGQVNILRHVCKVQSAHSKARGNDGERYSAELAVTLIDVSLQSSHLQQRLWSTDLNFNDVKHLKRSNTQRNLPDTYINDVSAFTLLYKTSHIR